MFKIIRNGQFRALRDVSNQCVEEGHECYWYQVVLIFSGDTPLDDNGFLIDTREIDQIVQEARLIGSCEQMHLQLLHTFCRKCPQLEAVHFSIKKEENAQGWIEFSAGNPVYL